MAERSEAKSAKRNFASKYLEFFFFDANLRFALLALLSSAIFSEIEADNKLVTLPERVDQLKISPKFVTVIRYLAHDYSLLLYGLGSKLPVMKEYYEHLRAQDFDCLFFNAWRDDASDKVLFDTILTDALDEKPAGSVENAVERLVAHYSSDDAFQLVIFLNNIESNCVARSLDLLVELVTCKKVSLVATIDKIYGAFAFDQCQRSQLNFISVETATFMPYVHETKSGHSIWAKSAGKIGNMIVFIDFHGFFVNYRVF